MMVSPPHRRMGLRRILLYVAVVLTVMGGQQTVSAATSRLESCQMRKNSPNLRVSLARDDPFQFVVGCATGNYEDDMELHVVSVIRADEPILLNISEVPKAVARDIHLVLMSAWSVTWKLQAPDSLLNRIKKVTLISDRAQDVDFKFVGNPSRSSLFPVRHRDFYGIGTNKNDMDKLQKYLNKQPFTSYSGMIKASSPLNLEVGINYKFNDSHPNKDLCAGMAEGFHEDVYSEDCSQFLMCINRKAYTMRCSDGLFLNEKRSICEGQTGQCKPAELPIPIDAAPCFTDPNCCLKDLHCWTEHPFMYDGSHSLCTGKQYVRLTKYSLYVGVVLCTQSRYKLFLSRRLNETFLDIGDSCGLGKDHCELVAGSEVNGRTGRHPEGIYSGAADGYYRDNWGEELKQGTIGVWSKTIKGWNNKYIPYWYECGVDIPGANPVEIGVVETIELVKEGDKIGFNCSIPGAEKYKWYKNVDLYGGKGTFKTMKPTGAVYEFDKPPHDDNKRGRKVTCCSESSPWRCVSTVWYNVDYGLRPCQVEPRDPFRRPLVKVTNNLNLIQRWENQNKYVFRNGFLDQTLQENGFQNLDETLQENGFGLFTSQNDPAKDATCAKEKMLYYITPDCGHASNLLEFGAEIVLKKNNARGCSGVMLSSQWLLSAAHCFDSQEAINLGYDSNKNIKIRINGTDGLTYNVEKKIIHPDYNKNSHKNDIALVRLVGDGVKSNHHSVCLGRSSLVSSMLRSPPAIRSARLLRYRDDRPEDYQLIFNSPRFCWDTSNEFDVDSTFCASSRSDGLKSSKKGDSGGGYLMQYQGQWFVVGIVSGSPNQAHTTTTYFTRPEHFYKWIKDTMVGGKKPPFVCTV